MKLSTEVKIKPSQHQISYQSRVLLLGSCFANNMGEKLQYYEFDAVVNPLGIIFNPISIVNLIERALASRFFIIDDLVYHNEQWHCFETHSEMSHSNQEICLHNLNEKLIALQTELLQAAHLIITLGSAWIYKQKSSQKVVANCHKIPQNQFEKSILSIEEIQDTLNGMLKKLHQKNPNIQIIWTISPVRHQKDGFIENQRSKSHLFVALHAVLDLKKDSNQYYFPSYELLIDELRDYRFYANDMLHPSEIAIEFIWQKFKENVINSNSFHLMDQIRTFNLSKNHVPFNPKSDKHKLFLEVLNQKKGEIQKQKNLFKQKN